MVSAAPQALAATATGTASADIVPAIAIQSSAALDFGNVAPGATAGTVVMTPAGARSATGGVTLSNVDPGQAAQFTVTGDSGATYAITLPSSATITSGANSMTIDNFTSDPSGTGLLTGGSQTLKVGGTLNVAANQAQGSYSGTFDVSVAYN